ncbi:MAG: 4-hydroxy-tetrahydrodipicolinate reductase [Muribaculaceae bacterium]|nr:4-hydroxy-tetrahydrodipicolinate reductase [Muribaculaceae bacterium]MDE6753025.1 4-hydroxy-tetrahydrodipicolinate reductase [Muribaculaceae bacterium]
MKLAIIGYGRMGHLIEKIALERGHKIVCIIDADNTDDFNSPEFKSADVAIEFTTPATAVDNILASFAAEVPVVVGTTGWNNSLPDIKDMCEKGRGTLLFASNFSIGVNIFMAVNRYLAKVMNDFPEYTPSMTEIHHIHKLDHPSGTAVTLADELVAEVDRLNKWEEPTPGKKLSSKVLPVDHIREGEVPGTHIITWDSEVDSITLKHEAKSRVGFALGAVKAAEWLKGKKGFFTIADMLSDVTHTTGLFV